MGAKIGNHLSNTTSCLFFRLIITFFLCPSYTVRLCSFFFGTTSYMYPPALSRQYTSSHFHPYGMPFLSVKSVTFILDRWTSLPEGQRSDEGDPDPEE